MPAQAPIQSETKNDQQEFQLIDLIVVVPLIIPVAIADATLQLSKKAIGLAKDGFIQLSSRK